MEQTKESRKKYTWWLLGIAAACILLYLGVSNIGIIADAISWVIGLISPLLIGLAIAVILNVPMQFFEAHFWPKAKNKFAAKLRRPTAFVVSLFVILGVFAGIIYLVIPNLVEAITMLVERIKSYVEKISSMSKADIEALPFGEFLINIDWKGILDDLTKWLTEESGNIMGTAVDVVASLIGGIYNLFIAFMFSVYILFSKETLIAQVRRLVKAWLPKKASSWLLHATSVTAANFRNFIAGQTLEALILGVLCMVGMFILGLPNAPVVGALVGVTALIPVVGAFVGAIIGAFIILATSPYKALIFLIFLLVLQQIEENVIYPRVMGSRMNLPAIWILAAVTIGGGISGPVGMLLGVPLASTVYTLLREATENREKKQKLKEAAKKLQND